MRIRSRYPLKTRLEMWESDFGRFSDWVLELRGLPIAELKFIQNPEAYWGLYETRITADDSALRQNMLTPQFWEKSSHSELVWRNADFDCVTSTVTAVLQRVESSDKIILQLRYLSIDDIELPRFYEKVLLRMRRLFGLNKYSDVKGSRWGRNSYKIKERLEIWESNYGRNKGWILEKSGSPIAEVRFLQTPEMFWDMYEVAITTTHPALRQRMLTAEFWERDTYEDLGWRNVYFDFYTQFASPILQSVESSNRVILKVRYLYIQNVGVPKAYEKVLLWWRKTFGKAGSGSLPLAH